MEGKPRQSGFGEEGDGGEDTNIGRSSEEKPKGAGVVEKSDIKERIILGDAVGSRPRGGERMMAELRSEAGRERLVRWRLGRNEVRTGMVGDAS